MTPVANGPLWVCSRNFGYTTEIVHNGVHATS